MGTAAALLLAASTVLFAQPAAPTFEAATIKVDTSSDPETGTFEHGRFILHNASLKDLIGSAYDLRNDFLRGQPGWVNTVRYDVSAKADPAASGDSARVMLRVLLAERFALRLHHEQRQTPVLVLKVAKHGPKLQSADANSTGRVGCLGAAPLTCHKVTTATLALALRAHATGIDIPVIDETGLKGSYDVKLVYSLPERSGTNAPDSVTIFEALQQQLGLKLEKAKRPMDFLVVDHVEPLAAEK
jgi:uncharacterized protein (TIGR03435 family)